MPSGKWPLRIVFELRRKSYVNKQIKGGNEKGATQRRLVKSFLAEKGSLRIYSPSFWRFPEEFTTKNFSFLFSLFSFHSFFISFLFFFVFRKPFYVLLTFKSPSPSSCSLSLWSNSHFGSKGGGEKERPNRVNNGLLNNLLKLQLDSICVLASGQQSYFVLLSGNSLSRQSGQPL